MYYKEAIITYLAQNNMTYAEFSKKSKISLPYVNNLLNGKRNNPSRKTLMKIQLIVGKPVFK